jgi:hypothetical protein
MVGVLDGYGIIASAKNRGHVILSETNEYRSGESL